MKDNNRNNDDAKREQEIADLAKYLKEKSLTIDEYLSEDEWNKFLVSNSAPQQESSEKNYEPVYNATLRKTKRNRNIYTGVKLAAVLVICISAYFLLDVNRFFSRTTEAPHLAYAHKNTTTGIEKITLPDGSGILLYPNSEIQYLSDYNTDRRNLNLTGSAVFDVAKNDRSPFTVYCRTIATTAIGTKFQVNGWGENPYVHLYEGKVIVKGIRDSTVSRYLSPGQAVAYMEKENVFQAMNGAVTPDLPAQPAIAAVKKSAAAKAPRAEEPAAAAPIETTDHASNRAYLNFQNKKLSTVFDFLADKYNVEIRYPTDIAISTNVLLSVDAGQPVEKILENICRISGLTANKLDDRTYTISK